MKARAKRIDNGEIVERDLNEMFKSVGVWLKGRVPNTLEKQIITPTGANH